jgi:hypothetical protein
MADTKISALPASTTPLAGTEVLPIVQSGVTRQVSVANLTAGRAVSTTELTTTAGNVVISDATKGLQLAKGGHIAAGGTINPSTTKTVTITMSGAGSYAVTIVAAMNVYGGGQNAIAQFMVGGDVANNNSASAAVVGPTNLGNCVISGLTLAAGSITFTMQNTNAVQTGRAAVTVVYSQSDGNTATVTIV